MTERASPHPRLLVALTLLILAAGYTLAASGEAAAPRGDLEGTTWRLQLTEPEYREMVVTMRFDQGTVSGSTGCNHYGGTYDQVGNTLRFEEVMQTLILCLNEDGSPRREFPPPQGTTQLFEVSGDPPHRTLRLRTADTTLEYTETQ